MIEARAQKSGSLLVFTAASLLMLLLSCAGCRTFDRGTVSDAETAPGAEAPLLATR